MATASIRTSDGRAPIGGIIDRTEPAPRAALRRIALLGNHLPRQCGIATFTADLADALEEISRGLDCFVLAMSEPGKHYTYPPRVRFEIASADLSSYRRAADFLNVNDVDVVNVQHEYGIFGGRAGGDLLTTLRELRMPIVTTLHTILAEPSPEQRAVLDEVIRLSERVIVMDTQSAELLARTHGISKERLDVIPHGIPSVPFHDESKRRLGLEDKKVILTFGLLSPDKGIEYVIDAMPAILEQCPDAVYIVLGATHPHVREQNGEAYRLMLEQRAQRGGVASSLIFHDRFVSRHELSEFLSAADVYVTPYLNPGQSTSGTLAYAVGAGKAVISTPYAYARELLADGRGILVPPRDPAAIAREAIVLLGNDEKRLRLRVRAAAHGRSMLWPAVAARYRASFERARTEHTGRLRTAFRAKTLAERPAELPALNFEHLRAMSDETGMLQHATFNVPRYADGYCLDDNARALHLMAMVEDAGLEEVRVVRGLASRYLAFVQHSFNSATGRFRNLMSYSREWLEECGSDDSHGRALWALGTVVGRSSDSGRRTLGAELFQAALPAVSSLTSPRAWAFALLGIDEYLRAFRGERSVQALRTSLVDRLLDLFRRSSSPDWPWFETRLSYCNAHLSQAMITSGWRTDRQEITDVGLQSLEWLSKIQRSEDGYFAPIGSNGFYERGSTKALFDQQPVEAGAMVSAAFAARRATGDARWSLEADRTFSWFVGQNHLHRSLYDETTGGCRDGLHADRPNENQGAESTLVFLSALLEMRSADRPRPTAAAVASGSS